MKIQIESTKKVVEFNGIPCRIWEGETDTGIKVHCYITRIAVSENERNVSQFEDELKQCRKPSLEIDAIPLRLVL